MNPTGADELSSNQLPTAIEVISEYISALAARNSQGMHNLRAEDFSLDFVQRDAFIASPLSNDETEDFWSDWFSAFPEMDYQVTRTIAGEELVVTEWVFMGTHSAPLAHPIYDQTIQPTGKTIRFRGVTVYEVTAGYIQRETTYMDLSTLFVELGVSL